MRILLTISKHVKCCLLSEFVHTFVSLFAPAIRSLLSPFKTMDTHWRLNIHETQANRVCGQVGDLPQVRARREKAKFPVR